MRFLGMTGCYNKFCYNFSIIAESLTKVLGKRFKFIWTDNCQMSFEKLKAMLKSAPVILAPSFDKELMLSIVASDVGYYSKIVKKNVSEITLP